MATEMLRLEAFYNGLKDLTGLNIFDIDIAKDEVDANKSFFLYYDKGAIRKDDSGRNLLRDFTLMYVTKENKDIDEYKIIEESPKWGLRFRSTDYTWGHIGETQDLVRITTFYFHQVVKGCL